MKICTKCTDVSIKCVRRSLRFAVFLTLFTLSCCSVRAVACGLLGKSLPTQWSCWLADESSNRMIALRRLVDRRQLQPAAADLQQEAAQTG
jgi:hypothetical protein